MDDYIYDDYDYGSNNSNGTTNVTCHYQDDGQQVVCNGKIFENSEYYEPGEPLFYIYLGAYAGATLFAGEFTSSNYCTAIFVFREAISTLNGVNLTASRV